MGDGRKVRITLTSAQDGSSFDHSYSGEWFRKERSIYIRYTEAADSDDKGAGEVRTLIRYRPEELSILRRGAVESEQLFTAGQRRIGRYRSAAIAFELETDTSKLGLIGAGGSASVDEHGLPSQLPFTLEWAYEMRVNEQSSGRFDIRLYIQEDTHQ
ncbi:DUF1934 domain-containing protein [Paenibacillus harenae]|uniref:DUF1934 domain-containing protein n=1 Tax=Paenibacillus harenae TaxID=306543 RepID=UPI00278D7637|nr:DUF1934 domain-containing protein [Paenibacillus harenae]MDQ0063860.1 uncharacterized beta-barrel protein YwiB (DUF1934 family) [Paenibacillus harenae]